MNLTERAIIFVTEAMTGKTRKTNNTPAVLHSLETGAVAALLTDDEKIIAAALLHDVIEDAGVTQERLREMFGNRVTELVLSETEDKRRDIPPYESWIIRKQEAIELLRSTDDIGTKIIFLSDKLSNLRSLANDINRIGDKVWQCFNQKDPECHHRYYRAVADAITELSDTFAWREYDALIKSIFKE